MYDVIVVGARCAGSPTAMLLARQGDRFFGMVEKTFTIPECFGLECVGRIVAQTRRRSTGGLEVSAPVAGRREGSL